MRTRIGQLIVLFVALAAASASAAEFHVKLDGTGDFTAIQEAIDAAEEGDTIIVHPGTFYENIHFNGKNITLRSTDPTDWNVVEATIVDGGHNDSVVRFAGTEDKTCELRGFKITHGRASWGGGICGGPGLYEAHARAVISSCIIRSNRGFEGGGVAFCDGVISNCEVADNTPGIPNWTGGGLFGCNGEITGCTIRGHSSYGGAGLSMCNARISHCVITGNSSGFGAGLVGGGDWAAKELFDCLIAGNDGQGVRYYNGPITNCTIVGNTGAGLSLCRGTISNCVVWDCTPPVLWSSTPSYSCIQLWSEGGQANIDDDPVFVAGPFGEYYLDPDSPCIDAGSMPAEEAGLSDRTTQADGTPDTGVVDMGFHYPALEAQVEVSCSLNADEFASGDLMRGFMSVENRGVDVMVDIFAVITMQDGSMISLTENGFAVGILPWLSDLTLSSGFVVEPVKIFELIIPPDAAGGHYTYLTAVSRPDMGSLGILSADECPFQVTAPVLFDYYVNAELGDDSNDGSEDSPWKTITHALDSVEGSEAHPITIHVAAGTYAASTNGETFPLNLKSWVSLSGEDPETTVLDVEQGLRSAIDCRHVESVMIEGFTVTGARPFQLGERSTIHCFETSSVVIQNNVIVDNSAYEGGGIFFLDSSGAVRNNTISANNAFEGGALACYNSSLTIEGNLMLQNVAGAGGGTHMYLSSASIRSNIIVDNWAIRGGGIECSNSSGNIADNMIVENRASQCGGAIYSWYASPTISNNMISANSTGGYGGGIDCRYGSPNILNNTITDNEADSDGGAVFCRESSPNISNNTITGNKAGWGGGISCHYEGSPTISNNTIADNQAESEGGGVFNWTGSPSIFDCIIWGNGDDLFNCSATYSCIEDGDPGAGNIHKNPMFVEGPLGDHYLDPDSPCIDAGSMSAEEAGLSDRTSRTDGVTDTGTVDMGYHYPLP